MSEIISQSSSAGEETATLKPRLDPPTNNGHSSCSPAVQEANTTSSLKTPLKELQYSRRAPSKVFKNLFVPRNHTRKDKCCLAKSSNKTFSPDIDADTTREGFPSFSRSISMTKSFTPKNLCRTTSGLRSTSHLLKKKSQNPKEVGPLTQTAGNKPALVKLKKQNKCQTIWEIPPLFQAYPQAIKASHLSASTLSAEAIIRIDHGRISDTVRTIYTQFDQRIKRNQSKMDIEKVSISETADNFFQPQHSRKLSKQITASEWTKKVFVLVTSGYLLQYSGSGRHDRMPEKYLKLGKDSVAFACDAIPGKHWVLQVSQSMDSNGRSTATSRSIRSRLSFGGTNYRKIVKSFLLVFESADELDSWIFILRREIKMLGGGRYDRDVETFDRIENSSPSLAEPWQRSPTQYTEEASPSFIAEHRPAYKNSSIDIKPEVDYRTLFRHHSDATIRNSIGNNSVTNSFVSQEGMRLQNLSDSQRRFSYLSSSQRTTITSRTSSPNSSPTLSAHDFHHSRGFSDEFRFRPMSHVTLDYKKSCQLSENGSQESLKSIPQGLNEIITEMNLSTNSNPVRRRSRLRKSAPDASQMLALTSQNSQNINLSTRSFKSKRPNSHEGIIYSSLLCDRVNNLNKNMFSTFPQAKESTMLVLNPIKAVGSLNYGVRGSIFNNTDEILTGFLAPNQSNPQGEKGVSQLVEQYSDQSGNNTQLESNLLNQALIQASTELDHPDSEETSYHARDLNNNPLCEARKFLPISCLRAPDTTLLHTTALDPSPNHIADQFVPHSNLIDTIQHDTQCLYPSAPSQYMRCKLQVPEHRRSLPTLFSGPPPLPPPKCALPPLPPKDLNKKVRIRFHSSARGGRSISDGCI